jgi:hypothetical protein
VGALETGEPAGRRAGGDDESVEHNGDTVGQGDLAGAEVERLGPDPQPQVEVDPLLHAKPHPVHFPFAGHVLLRQGRTVVRPMGFVSNQRELARVALAPERLGGAQAGQPSPDDDDSLQWRDPFRTVRQIGTE